MPLERIIENGQGNKVAIWHLTENLDELLTSIQLSEEDLATVNGFKLDKRKQEWVCARLILQQLTNNYPKIAYTSNGKPFLVNQQQYISISHTNKYVAVSVSNQPTALDIEIVSPRVERAAKRFVHEEENTFITPEATTDYLTLIWCAKETLYKYFDEFGVVFKEHFRISRFALTTTGHMHSHCNYKSYNKNLILNFEVTPNYTIVYHLNE